VVDITTATQLKFYADVKRSIDSGVPVMVSTTTASKKRNVGLPSWRVYDPLGFKEPGWQNVVGVRGSNPQKPTSRNPIDYTNRSDYHDLKGGGHWIPIVGYDSGNFYYVDTCGHGSFGPNSSYDGCRNGPFDDDSPARRTHYYNGDGTPGRDHVWRISQSDMYFLMREYGFQAGTYIAFTGVSTWTHAAY
jgi:hypothetical protein